MRKLTEEEKEIITRIVKNQSSNIYGYMDIEDIQSEIWCLALEILNSGKYQKSEGPLENFLRVSIKNRLVNKYRKMMKPVRPPCPRCIYYDQTNSGKYINDCKKYQQNRENCSKWNNYEKRKESRLNLLSNSEDVIEREVNNNTLNKLMAEEIIVKVRKFINAKFLNDFNKLINNEKLNKIKREKILNVIRDILNMESEK